MIWLALLQSAIADDPRVSTSRGHADGVVVLYPRVIPATEDPVVLEIARAIHARTEAVARKGFPSGDVDVRPEPQRVCPKAGCKAVSVGSVFVHRGETCAVAAWVAPPGKKPPRAVPWSEGLEIKPEPLEFREPVENALLVKDYQPCATLVESLGSRDGDVVKAIFDLKP